MNLTFDIKSPRDLFEVSNSIAIIPFLETVELEFFAPKMYVAFN